MSKIILFLALFINLTSYILNPNLVYAQSTSSWDNGRCTKKVGDVEVATIQGLECLFANVLTVVTYVAGISFFFMFIVNGFKYIFSSSDQKQLAQISSSITLAVIGLAGVIISWLVLSFIQNFFFGDNPLFDIDITKFSIPGGSP